MKVSLITIILLYFLNPLIGAQGVSLSQSDSSYDWMELETPFVKLIFPKGREKDALKIAGLVDSYAPYVGVDFNIEKLEQFPLILRPGLAMPNGFVTLGPRRSEWFAHESFSPFLGGLNFYQALAIHEYRHITQFDYNYRSNNKFGYYLFGEFGSSILLGVGLPSWYFEGDAVYAESFYTNGGRGKSPRFLARLKALVLSGQVPSYDEFVGGSYKNFLPNHYTYGHVLVTRARRKYGDKFWAKVVDNVATFSLNPYRIYSAIETFSGVSFKQFYNETFEELKDMWQEEGDHLKKTAEVYERQLFPFFDGGSKYLLKKSLNSYWGVFKNEDREPLVELPLSPELSKVDLKNDRIAYTQFLPDTRFGFQGFSDLFIYDLKSKSRARLTHNKRLFHPAFSPDGKLIAVTSKGDDGKWSIHFYNREGVLTSKVGFKGMTPMEVSWKNNDEIYILGQDELGYKSLDLFSRAQKKKKRIFKGTRNNIFAIRFSDGQLSFEADWQGKVEAFTFKEGIRDSDGTLKKCSESIIGAFTPITHKGKIFYTSELDQGQRLESRELSECRPMSLPRILGAERLSVKSPSDSFVPPNKKVVEPSVISSAVSEIKESSQFFSGLTPHSWSFIGGNGFQVSLAGNNLLGTFGYNVATGINTAESRPFTNISLSYAEYFPILSIGANYRERNSEVTTGAGKEQWNEFESSASITLPFSWVNNFYFNNLQLSVFGGIINIGDRSGVGVYEANDERLDLRGGLMSWSIQKAKTFQQIIPEYGLELVASYRKSNSKRRATVGSEQSFGSLKLYLPAFAQNDGFKLQVKREKQSRGLRNYRHTAFDDEVFQYTFSRGFSYGYVDQYTKMSADYVVPLLNPNWNLLNFHYLKRVYTSLFFDHTDLEILGFKGELQSFGSELVMQTNLFRRFPLDWGVRFSQKVDGDSVFDFFLGSQVGF